MLFGPIFQVELVTAARQRRQYLLRVFYATIILFVLWVSYSSVSQLNRSVSGGNEVSISDLANTATTFFFAFTWVQLLGILAIAPVMAVGTIATERERRTIEYLFATDLSNFEIVVGKTFARLVIVGQLVLVSLPILFIFRLLGGIPADLLGASFLIAASTALLLTSLSVCISVWSPRSRDAVMRVYRVLAVLIIIPIILYPLLTIIQMQNLGNEWWAEAFAAGLNYCWAVNPITVLGKSMSGVAAAGAGFDFDPVLNMAAWHLAFSVALVALATTAVRRVHLRDSSRGETSKKRNGDGLRWWERFRWRPQLGDNAMLWKEAFAPTAKVRLGFVGVAANAIIVVVACFFTAYFFYLAMTEIGGIDEEIYYYYAGTVTVVLGTGFMLLMAGRAAGLVTIEKERDCWISLLSTPMTGGEIMRAKMLGNLYAARWGLIILTGIWLLGGFFDVRYLLMVPLLAGSFLLCILFVTNVGLEYSLASSTSLRAMGATLATVFFIGGGYLFCCCFTFAAAGGGDGGGFDLMAVGMAPCLPYIVSAPAWLFANGVDSSEWKEMLAAYIIGVIGYAIANAVLAADLSMRFDQRSGRTIDSPAAQSLRA